MGKRIQRENTSGVDINQKIVAQMWSGGKDSTCAGIKHLERGDKVHFICYIPMFDADIPLIEKCHWDFQMQMADFFRSQGATVHFTHGDYTYWEYCTKILTRGKRAGSMQSYPCYIKGKCGFNRDSKTPACNNVAKTLKYDVKDIGLCADEIGRKKLEAGECSILQELGITKQMAFDFCRDNKFLSPTYKNKKRDGCLLCPHAKASERLKWFEDWKEFNAKERLIELQRILIADSKAKGTKQFYPLRNYHYFIENAGEFISPNGTRLCMFGDTIN